MRLISLRGMVNVEKNFVWHFCDSCFDGMLLDGNGVLFLQKIYGSKPYHDL